MSIIKTKTYNDSKHTKNNYRRWIKTASQQDIIKEYNKINLIMQMMKHKGQNSIAPYPKKETKQDNITIIKYKYNILCQYMTNNYNNTNIISKKNNRYHSR